ncbi:ATP-dependent RNA helicase [bacterium (Candidatus Blackallbacteria) CG17_big_fil_post_rev_8_21_14_2_50_48_46]|uniref:ATP-dependent RNA helicase DeaD n=1 Tax=bacterium (Candidatus Blackallbacteria) CG17_big_fil_post_rev_8_21_14_2_50_48_46 TaxID=2014261 RepID=A0A2M7G3X7_9BACT|nr:MAG: ATP-dependent RNA helicase [bacterium (Candidatus Blackallbacteria) CG18_big_fil_WC_8_21_14_2_50_49_26]PIW16586.1 MAG: ATP-dependent RNA helicase [bacterium (Candidatus Blackallbacteria) CG17_big_fil_post_rev_8_21_14_2_50_48_46]PIW46094.1 MAG: ATP-dependent RNA helicase [bacterium (Candidatus Blackallbacteria) CG13_big_fil_rev_8_21_14_2_50_49_14]
MPHETLLPEHLFLNPATIQAPPAPQAKIESPAELPSPETEFESHTEQNPPETEIQASVQASDLQAEPLENLSEAPEDTASTSGFAALKLAKPVLEAVLASGYEDPTPIQASMIPHVLAGKDVLGQAQTGTGKTAAFALPLLSRMDSRNHSPQILVLAPTRELALQVSDSFERYGAKLPGLKITAIYGGQSYGPQLRDLRQGAQIVIGTPGRVMDHMRRGSLDLSNLQALVLDEADEMLNMGFAEDVEWILSQTPEARQTALFSATMPPEIRRLARKYLKDPVEIALAAKTTTADTIQQRFWIVRGLSKQQALIRLLESEPIEGVLIFVRTKDATIEVAQRLENAGYKAAALNGDLPQNQREQTVERLRRGKLDVLVATDVAARGLDVERISHVINYDVPFDPESYTHRIGRTGRAGRSGEAILLIEPREQRLLSTIERATRQPMTRMFMPDAESLNQKRVERFKSRISQARKLPQLEYFREMMLNYAQENEVPLEEVAAALALLVQGKTPLLLPPDPPGLQADPDLSQRVRKDKFSRERSPKNDSEMGLVPYRVEVGRIHGLRPSMLVGAIANEAGVDSKFIGKIKMHDTYSVVDLPLALEKHFFKALAKTRVVNHPLRISRLGKSNAFTESAPRSFDKKPKFSPAPKGRPDHAPRAKAGKRGFLGK